MAILRGTKDSIEVNAVAKITEDLGKVTTLKFKVRFKRLAYSDAKQMVRAMTDPDSDVTEQTLIRDTILAWRDLPGDGGDVEYNDENLEAMLEHPEYLNALMDAWGSAQLGRVMANAKN